MPGGVGAEIDGEDVVVGEVPALAKVADDVVGGGCDLRVVASVERLGALVWCVWGDPLVAEDA